MLYSLHEEPRQNRSQSASEDTQESHARAEVSRLEEGLKKYLEFEIDYYQDEDGIFTAVVPAIRGCVASGKTLKEAYRNAVDAIESCLEARRKVAALRLRKARYNGLNVYRRAVSA
jgi:predicted RNase H-like HicB family nuclease